MWREQAIIQWSDLVRWSLLLLAATVWSFAHLPLGLSDRNTMIVITSYYCVILKMVILHDAIKTIQNGVLCFSLEKERKPVSQKNKVVFFQKTWISLNPGFSWVNCEVKVQDRYAVVSFSFCGLVDMCQCQRFLESKLDTGRFLRPYSCQVHEKLCDRSPNKCLFFLTRCFSSRFSHVNARIFTREIWQPSSYRSQIRTCTDSPLSVSWKKTFYIGTKRKTKSSSSALARTLVWVCSANKRCLSKCWSMTTSH